MSKFSKDDRKIIECLAPAMTQFLISLRPRFPQAEDEHIIEACRQALEKCTKPEGLDIHTEYKQRY